MALTPSTMLPLGTKVPPFRLPDPQGKYVSSEDFKNAPALLVAFICNHCPYVKHIRAEFAKVAREYQAKGVGIVGIMSNDLGISPDDRPEKMAEEARQMGYVFPYLFDATQEVAKAYHAACTPDLYLFDGKGLLVYRGQFDASRPDNGIPVTGKDLRAALDKVLAGEAIPTNQTPSIGCNIKWKSGNEPHYAMNA
jgi:peroxiredoxin